MPGYEWMTFQFPWPGIIGYGLVVAAFIGGAWLVQHLIERHDRHGR